MIKFYLSYATYESQTNRSHRILKMEHSLLITGNAVNKLRILAARQWCVPFDQFIPYHSILWKLENILDSLFFDMIDGASRPQPLLSRGFRSYAFNRSQVARTYFRQIVRAISYCHRLHVVHRDLKPENVVFFEKLGTVKLTDFGFSNRFCPGQKLETSCGSLAYSAPEILLGDSYDAPAVGEYDNIDLFQAIFLLVSVLLIILEIKKWKYILEWSNGEIHLIVFHMFYLRRCK